MTVLSTDNFLSVTGNHFDVTVLPIIGVALVYFKVSLALCLQHALKNETKYTMALVWPGDNDGVSMIIIK